MYPRQKLTLAVGCPDNQRLPLCQIHGMHSLTYILSPIRLGCVNDEVRIPECTRFLCFLSYNAVDKMRRSIES
jgi:hypothetical protein